MDASARNRLPAPQNAARTQQTTRSDAPPIMSEIDGRVDQIALVQDTLLNGATPTMIAGFAMIIAQIQAQATYSDVSLTITSRVGPIERSATFRDGAWHGYDLTHSLIDPRSHLVFGEPTRPPMDQERSLRISQSAVHTPTTTPLPSPLPVQFSCTLPMVPPPVPLGGTENNTRAPHTCRKTAAGHHCTRRTASPAGSADHNVTRRPTTTKLRGRYWNRGPRH